MSVKRGYSYNPDYCCIGHRKEGRNNRGLKVCLICQADATARYRAKLIEDKAVKQHKTFEQWADERRQAWSEVRA